MLSIGLAFLENEWKPRDGSPECNFELTSDTVPNTITHNWLSIDTP